MWKDICELLCNKFYTSLQLFGDISEQTKTLPLYDSHISVIYVILTIVCIIFSFTHDPVAYIHIFYMYLIKIVETDKTTWWKYHLFL